MRLHHAIEDHIYHTSSAYKRRQCDFHTHKFSASTHLMCNRASTQLGELHDDVKGNCYYMHDASHITFRGLDRKLTLAHHDTIKYLSKTLYGVFHIAYVFNIKDILSF